MLNSGISTHGPTRGPTNGPYDSVWSFEHFNSRPHTGADLTAGTIRSRRYQFQLTAPHGGRLVRRYPDAHLSIFQLTAPHGGRLFQALDGSKSLVNFNSRPHTGADSSTAPNIQTTVKFQLTAPHGGRQQNSIFTYRILLLSLTTSTNFSLQSS